MMDPSAQTIGVVAQENYPGQFLDENQKTETTTTTTTYYMNEPQQPSTTEYVFQQQVPEVVVQQQPAIIVTEGIVQPSKPMSTAAILFWCGIGCLVASLFFFWTWFLSLLFFIPCVVLFAVDAGMYWRSNDVTDRYYAKASLITLGVFFIVGAVYYVVTLLLVIILSAVYSNRYYYYY